MEAGLRGLSIIMCGFAGYFGFQNAADSHRDALSRMARRLAHRGPDGEGFWFDESADIGLCHRRLAILDLTEAGKQPMISSSGRFVIAFNGEIYNYAESRKDLAAAGHTFRGHSDTETLVEAIAAWGLDATLKRCAGMFAFALWDRAERSLTLVRDRMGVKPLYYATTNKSILFGSDISAIAAHPGFDSRVDRQSLAAYTQFNAVPEPTSILEGVRKLAPGTWMKFDRDPNGGLHSTTGTYWSLREVAERSKKEGFIGSEAEAVNELEMLLKKSVQRRLVSDVPVGAFLSGGVDSATVVSIMRQVSDQPVKTFTIGSADADYDESDMARRIAKHLGCEHHEWIPSAQEIRDAIPQMGDVFQEPFADPSQIPTLLVSKLAQRHVKVSLSGDGGDELFGGYDRYIRMSGLWKKISRLPFPARRALGAALSMTPARLIEFANNALPQSKQLRDAGAKTQKLAAALCSRTQQDFYIAMRSFWPQSSSIVAGMEASDGREQYHPSPDGFSFEETMMLQEQGGHLPDDLLVKLDRASMAVGLEAREPMLDHELVEFSWRLPLEWKIRNGQGKQILRRVLDRHIPREWFERPKQGFLLPLDTWMRGPLRDWAEDLLSESRIKRDGYLISAPIRSVWRRFLDGAALQYPVWNILMFQVWLERFKSSRASA